jgi:hypothetical protein
MAASYSRSLRRPLPISLLPAKAQFATPNRVTGELKEMILQALDESGGVEYLKQQAVNNPAAFLMLIGKVLPLQVNARTDGHFTVSWLK